MRQCYRNDFKKYYFNLLEIKLYLLENAILICLIFSIDFLRNICKIGKNFYSRSFFQMTYMQKFFI